MQTSGELRRSYQGQRTEQTNDSQFERADKLKLTPADRAFVDGILERHRAGRSKELGQGRSAKVIILDFWDSPEALDLKRWVIKSEQQQTREQKALGITLLDEMELQHTARTILEKARGANPDKQYAAIPEPMGVLYETEPSTSDRPTRWFVMEHVDGVTLFEKTLQEFILTFRTVGLAGEDLQEAIDDVRSLRKEDLVAEIVNDAEIFNMLPPRYRDELSGRGAEGTISPHIDLESVLNEESFLGIGLAVNRYEHGPSPIISMEQYQAIQNTIEALHTAGFHHRDLHPSNIMINQDGGVYIIDFGLSVHLKGDTRGHTLDGDGGIYTRETGHPAFHSRVVKMPSDVDQLEQIYKIARKVGVPKKSAAA